MKNSELEFSGKTIMLAEGILELEYPILDAFQLAGNIIVLFEPDAKKGPGQFRNLVALRPDGERIWEAELPTTMSSDAYYRFSSNPVVTDSLSSFSSTIDDSTGRILGKNFYK